MDRRHFLAASSVLSATLLCQAAQAQTENAVLPHVNWRMSSSFAPERDVIFDSALLLADVMRQLTAGRFNIEVHGANELAPIGDNFIKTKEGWFECAHTSLSLHSADEPSLSLMGGVPFGMNGRQLSSFLLYGGGQDAINDILSEHHLLAFALGQQALRCAVGFAVNYALLLISGAINALPQVWRPKCCNALALSPKICLMI